MTKNIENRGHYLLTNAQETAVLQRVANTLQDGMEERRPDAVHHEMAMRYIANNPKLVRAAMRGDNKHPNDNASERTTRVENEMLRREEANREGRSRGK